MASALDELENNALRAGSLMAIPPPPPGSQPLSGSTTVDLSGNSLTQWAYHIQDVASGMRLPPEAAASCPQSNIVGVLDRLEGMTRVRYCRHCFGVGQKCQCSTIPHQAPGPTSALWTPPTVSYATMASSTETTASTSAVGVTRPSYRPPGLPPLEAMDTLPAPTSENLLLTTGVSRGSRGWTQPQIPTTPGLRQMRPRMPQSQAPTPRRQEATPATPYQQPVYPPRTAAPKLSTTPSATQGCEGLAREDGGTRGRSSSRGSQDGRRGSRSSARGSQKCRWGALDSDLMDEMANYEPQGESETSSTS